MGKYYSFSWAILWTILLFPHFLLFYFCVTYSLSLPFNHFSYIKLYFLSSVNLSSVPNQQWVLYFLKLSSNFFNRLRELLFYFSPLISVISKSINSITKRKEQTKWRYKHSLLYIYLHIQIPSPNYIQIYIYTYLYINKVNTLIYIFLPSSCCDGSRRV